MTPASCSFPAEAVTPSRRTPSMLAMRSWVIVSTSTEGLTDDCRADPSFCVPGACWADWRTHRQAISPTFCRAFHCGQPVPGSQEHAPPLPLRPSLPQQRSGVASRSWVVRTSPRASSGARATVSAARRGTLRRHLRLPICPDPPHLVNPCRVGRHFSWRAGLPRRWLSEVRMVCMNSECVRYDHRAQSW
jgi:hypothetical protein